MRLTLTTLTLKTKKSLKKINKFLKNNLFYFKMPLFISKRVIYMNNLIFMYYH